MDKAARIFVAGHRGMVGSAIVRRLQREGYSSVIVFCRADSLPGGAAADHPPIG